MRLLPDGLAAHCKVMNLRRETLVISATSPAWAARLRFAAPELVKQLRCQFSMNVHTIEVRVLPEAFEIQSVIREKPEMSAASANLLAQTAQGVDHPGLREALYRLAAKTRDY